MAVATQRFKEAVEKDTLLRPARVHHHKAGLGRHQDVLAVQHHHAGCGHGPFLKEAAVALVLADGGLRVVPLRTLAPGFREVETAVRRYGFVLEGIVVEIYGRGGRAGGLVLLKVLAQHREVLVRRGGVKVYHVPERSLAQGFLYRGAYYLEYDGFLLELDLCLGRVDVHVHGLGVHRKVQEIGRRNAFRYEVLVRLHHRLVHICAAEIPAVHKEELVARGLAGVLRTSHKAAYLYQRSVDLNIYDLLRHGCAHQVHNPEFQGLCRLEGINFLAVHSKAEAHVRACEGHPLEFFQDVA